MKKHFLVLILPIFFSAGFIPADARATTLPSLTIATFADPSKDSNNPFPLFTVDFIKKKLTGGWDDDKTGLILEIPYSDHTFEDAWFEMTEVEITDTTKMWGQIFGQIGSGVINFYEDNNSTDPLVVINFESGLVSRYSFGANEIFVAENVTITGSKIPGTLSQEQFTFGFANRAKLPGHTNWSDGFTATGAFTSSAVPEPATMALLGLGSLTLLRRKRRA